MPNLAAMLFVLLQQPDLGRTGFSSPPRGDTTGYWQQRIGYTIVATLDEPSQRIRASGSMWYVNNSPDTLREMYVHQYLNAFRPGSKWSAIDEREGRERFQQLTEPHYGYERFTAPVRVNGIATIVDYPGAPDSTVAHFALPAALPPRDSILVQFEWDARPSTVPRRQGRRGRHWDLSQWFPKVAVYDRGGWQPNALRPAGEFYGEFGTFDVTLIVAQDQVIGATGVPIDGDPGWTRVMRGGRVRIASDAYAFPAPSPRWVVTAGFKAVRFYARDVHHFAWTASPDYRYEGGVYVRARTGRPSAARVPTWDTVSVHVLWRPGDDTTWGGQRAVRRTIAALQWLEAYYGPYPHPQLTTNHRLDGGGSELPMFMMNGSASQGLILHEGGHMYTFGALANNEWRSGWMDEGATSYQTAWAQLLTPQERARAGIVDRPLPVAGYRGLGIRMVLPRHEIVALEQALADIRGSAQPIGTVAHEFRDFNTYNDMIYDRSEVMHSQLRDLLGDSSFVAFNRDYYDRWALKHVDERSMRGSVERVSGRARDWFFDQWVHHTGLMDYQLRRVRQRDSSGSWITEATVRRRGEYRHPMIVGARTSTGWTTARMTREPYREETIRIVTQEKPLEVRLDPHHVTWDWNRRNDTRRVRTRYNLEWPFLEQIDRDRIVALFFPLLWYSETGGVILAARERGSYLGFIDRFEAGLGYAIDPRRAMSRMDRIPFWTRFENLSLRHRPAMGSVLDVANVDALDFARFGQTREHRASSYAAQYGAAVTLSAVADDNHLPEQWEDLSAIDLRLHGRLQRGRPRRGYAFLEVGGLGGLATNRDYLKGEISIGVLRVRERTRMGLRAYGGAATNDIPRQRALFVSSADPLMTFFNHWWRPPGAMLKRPGMNWLPLGGAALRGFSWALTDRALVGGNAEAGYRVLTLPVDGAPGVWINAFGDLAHGQQNSSLSDVGIGLALRGQIYDREITLRLDAPLFVNRPLLGIERDGTARDQFAGRWVVSFNDIW